MIYKFRLHLLCLIALITICILINIWWVNVDNRIPFAAPPWYFNFTFRYYWQIFYQFSLQKLQKTAEIVLHPPLVSMVVSPFYVLFGKNLDTAVVAMNIIFLPVLLFSIYKLTLLLTKKHSLALLSSFLVATYPTVITVSRYYLYDLPLMATVSLTFYYIFLFNNFRNIKYAIYLGMLLGLGMLVKQSFIIFVFSPLIYVMFKKPYSKYLKNALIILIIYFFVAGLWYIPNLRIVIKKIYHIASYNGLMHNDPKWLTLEGATFYLLELINNQISFFYMLFFIIALFLFIRSKTHGKNIFYLWIIIPYIIFTLAWAKEDRYIVPYLPAFAIITAVGLGIIKRNIIRRILFSFLIIYGVLQFITCTWAIPWVPEKIKLKNFERVYFFKQTPSTQRDFYNPRPENKKENKIREKYIYEIITKLDDDISIAGEENISRTILILSNRWAYNGASLDYFSIINNFKLKFWNIIESHLDVSNVINIIRQNRFRYIIDIKELSYLYWQEYEMKLKAVREWIQSHAGDFEILLEKWIPEDNLTLIIYKRKISY